MIRAMLLFTLLLSPVAAAAAGEDAPAAAATLDAAPPGPAQPMVVTSDTDAYCETLSRQIDQHGNALPQRIAFLRDQGQHLCAIGQVRSGINRLRRALMALREPDGRDPDGGTSGDPGEEPGGADHQ